MQLQLDCNTLTRRLSRHLLHVYLFPSVLPLVLLADCQRYRLFLLYIASSLPAMGDFWSLRYCNSVLRQQYLQKSNFRVQGLRLLRKPGFIRPQLNYFAFKRSSVCFFSLPMGSVQQILVQEIVLEA